MSEYGSMTLLPPGAWPSVDEDILASAAESYEALAAQLRNVVVPQQQAQLVTLANQWTGVASQAAQAEGAQLVQGHENNAAEAAAIANKLRLMEATSARTKTAVKLSADETQVNCDAIDATPVAGTAGRRPEPNRGSTQPPGGPYQVLGANAAAHIGSSVDSTTTLGIRVRNPVTR